MNRKERRKLRQAINATSSNSNANAIPEHLKNDLTGSASEGAGFESEGAKGYTLTPAGVNGYIATGLRKKAIFDKDESGKTQVVDYLYVADGNPLAASEDLCPSPFGRIWQNQTNQILDDTQIFVSSGRLPKGMSIKDVIVRDYGLDENIEDHQKVLAKSLINVNRARARVLARSNALDRKQLPGKRIEKPYTRKGKMLTPVATGDTRVVNRTTKIKAIDGITVLTKTERLVFVKHNGLWVNGTEKLTDEQIDAL